MQRYDLLPQTTIIIPPFTGSVFDEGSLLLDPKLPDGSKTTVRIIVIGDLCRDGEITGAKTAAFVDVTLEP